MLVDSGAEKNVVDEKTYLALQCRPKLEPSSKVKLLAFGAYQIEVVGCFSTHIEANGRICEAEIVVVRAQGENVLCLETARKLDLFEAEGSKQSMLFQSVKEISTGSTWT
jgi:hypothetical protein